MKKLVSRFMAVLMAMAMILSMSMAAFAADTPKGALTVNNTVAGKTLDLYQIFTATKNGDNVAYTLNSAYEVQISRHPVRTAHIQLFCPVIIEIEDTGMFQEIADDRTYRYVFADMRDADLQTADAADDQFDLHPCRRCRIECLDDLPVTQGIHFCNDMGFFSRQCPVLLSFDQS